MQNFRIALLCFAWTRLYAQGPANVVVIVNSTSADSRQIAEYYIQARKIPPTNICRINTTSDELIDRAKFRKEIAEPMKTCLQQRKLIEQALYLVTTLGIPLKIQSTTTGITSDGASVDSELTMLYPELKGAAPHALNGPINNPFFRQRDAPFTHPRFPIYMVTRLAAYNVAEVKAMIDRGLKARNVGKFVIDMPDPEDREGNNWLRDAALLLPKDRVIFDETPNVLYNQKQVIGYAAWGSNDRNRKQRWLNFEWLPGAIATEYVSTNARTFTRPPDNWNISWWDQKGKIPWFFGSPQTMSADYIHEGATGINGNVDEPYLKLCPWPQFVLVSYFNGRNLADSYYSGIPGLSWMTIVIGDPLTKLQ